jgi:hypothetical protein
MTRRARLRWLALLEYFLALWRESYTYWNDTLYETNLVAYWTHMNNIPSSEKETVEEEVSVLRERVGYLQRLIAELLMKNQQLREAIGPEHRNLTL